MARVLVMMSGGVDSSVAAALLAEQGHQVTGVTLKLWGGTSDSGCCSVGDVEDARRVAAQLGIAHYVFNLAAEFEHAVVGPYVDAYAGGRTPNPCVECNRSIKFGRVLARAEQLGFDLVATGHHARVRGDDCRYSLLRGADAAKDQSYVLYMLGQRELARTVLPVGELTKAEVRAHASRLGLRTAAKRESMDTCFVARRDRVEFVASRAAVRPGVLVDTDGREVGQHAGVSAFTIGQRRGHGVARGERTYVVDIDATVSVVTLGRRDDLLRDTVALRDTRWVDAEPRRGSVVAAQWRAHATPVEATVDGDELRFAVPHPRVAPGQVVACYDGERLLGGGVAA